MKKTLLTLVGLSALMSIHAQVVEIYKNGQLMQTYYNTPTASMRWCSNRAVAKGKSMVMSMSR